MRRLQIVEATADLLARRAPDEVTFEEIAEAAGVSRALVYNYFGDRGGLLAATYVHTFGDLDERLASTIASTLPPEERVRAMVVGYLGFAAEHPGAWRLLQSASGMSHPALRAAREEHRRRFALGFGGTAIGRVVAYGVLALLEAATVEGLEGATPVRIEDLADVLCELLWSGLSSLTVHGIALTTAK